MGKRKGARGEYRARDWAIRNGWPAIKTNDQAHNRGDTPDVIVDFHGTTVYLESKNDKTKPGKRFLADLAQSEGYCDQEQIPWLFHHVHGTSLDVISMSAESFERTQRAAFRAGQLAGRGVPFIPSAAVASVCPNGAEDRVA